MPESYEAQNTPRRVDDSEEARAMAEASKDSETEIARHERTIRDSKQWSLDTAEAEVAIPPLRESADFAANLAQALHRHPEAVDALGQPLDEEKVISLIIDTRLVRGQLLEVTHVLESDSAAEPFDELIGMAKRSGWFDRAGLDTTVVDQIGVKEGVGSEKYRRAASELLLMVRERLEKLNNEFSGLLKPIIEEFPEIAEELKM